MQQLTPSWCAPASLEWALRLQGIHYSQRELADALGTTNDGTDEEDIQQCLDSLGIHWIELGTNSKLIASADLVRWSPIAPILLCVDHWQHWVCAAGMTAGRILLFDPDRKETCQPVYPHTLVHRWRAKSEWKTEGHLYYGIVVLGRT